MQILVSHGHVVDSSTTDNYICTGSTVVNTEKCCNFSDCSIVSVTSLPEDIDAVPYDYVLGHFIRRETNELGVLSQHKWDRTALTSTEFTNYSLGTGNMAVGATYYYADSYTISNGMYTLISAQTINFYGSGDRSSTIQAALRGKYATTSPSGSASILYLDPDGTVTQTSQDIAGQVTYTYSYSSGSTLSIGTSESVYEDHINTYPQDGVSGDHYYQYQYSVLDRVTSCATIDEGSFLGTGTVPTNASTALSITFSRIPKIIYISAGTTNNTLVILHLGSASLALHGSATVTWSGTTMTYYGASGNQYNTSGQTYRYLAIG